MLEYVLPVLLFTIITYKSPRSRQKSCFLSLNVRFYVGFDRGVPLTLGALSGLLYLIVALPTRSI